MTATIEKTSAVPAALIANARAVLDNKGSSKAKRQEAMAVLTKAGQTPMGGFVEERKGPSTASGVLQTVLDKEEARKVETSKAVKASKAERQKALAVTVEPEVEAPVEEPAFDWDILAAELGATPEQVKDAKFGVKMSTELWARADDADAMSYEELARRELGKVMAKPAVAAVTDDELKEALAIIARATKQQAEAIRKAAAERKKAAPEGAKVKKQKELTQAQKDKLAKAEKAAETYSITCIAARSFVGKGLGDNTKMAVALSVLSLPTLRWLAKQYDLKIPADKKSAILIREYLRVELLTFKPKA